MAGSALFSQAINSITKFRKADSKPIVDEWSSKSVESACDDLPSKHSRLEVIHETTEEDEDEAPALLQAKSRQETVKIARPPSSHEDPFDGFTFTKPKIPQLNFSRKNMETSSMPMDQNSLQYLPSAQVIKPSNSSAISPGLTEKLQSTGIPHNTTNSIQNGVSLVPSPIVDQSARGISEESHAPTPIHETSNMSGAAQASSDTNTAANSEAKSQDAKPVNQLTSKITHEAVQPVSDVATNGPASRQSRNPQKNLNKFSKKPKTLLESRPQPTSHPADLTTSLNEEDLLSALLFHHRREQQRKETLKNSQHAKDLELEDLREVSNDLYQQLHYALEENKAKEIELSRFYSKVPQWENKVQRLKEHVQNLMNDQQELRKGADELDQGQRNAQADRSALNDTIQEVRESMNHDHLRTKRVLREAKHQMQMLEQTVENQDIQLQEDGELLDAERARSHRFENEMAGITKSHQELTKLFTGHRDEVANKLNNLLEKSDVAQTVNLPTSRDDLKPLLDQCLQMLQKIQNVEVVKPQDLQNLNLSVRNYAQGLTHSMQSCGRTSEMTRELQSKMSLDLQHQLHELVSSIKAEKTLSEQLMEVREMKATVKERLQITERALIEARQHAIVLESKEQLHMQNIRALELEISSKESDSLQLNSQVRELVVCNKDLHEQIATCHRDANGASKQLEQKIEEVSNLEEQINVLHLQLNDARVEAATSEDQKAAFESKAVEKLEHLRKQLSRSATVEQARMEGNYLNQIQQLQHEKSTVDEKAEQWKRQLSRLQSEKEEINNLAKERLRLLHESEAETKVHDENINILQTRIVGLELKVEQDTQHLQKTQDELRIATTELGARDTEILKLTATRVLKISANVEPINVERSDKPKRMVDQGNIQHKPIIEDSQNRDKSISQNQTGNEHRETSPVSSLDDLSELFPATPVLVSQNTKLENTKDQRNTHDVGSSARHITFAASALASPQLDETTDPPAERKPHSIPLKFSPQPHKSARHDSSSPQRNRLDIVARPSQSLLRRPTAKASKSVKRTASTAGLDEEIGPIRNPGSTNARGLGSVMPDSQIPHEPRAIAARGRKLPKVAARKATKEDKYARRFSQELN